MAAKRASAKTRKGTKKKSAKVTKMAMKASPKKLTAVKDPLTKGGIVRAIMDMTCLGKKDVAGVLESLGTLIELHVKPRGPGKFVLPGLLKINVVQKPARPARRGINPFTGEETTFKAKKAYKAVKVRPLRKLKEMVA